MIFDRIKSPWKTSTKVVTKFILFSAGVLILGLLILQGWYFHMAMRTKENILIRRLENPIKIRHLRHEREGLIIPKEQECFTLYDRGFCLKNEKRVTFMKHIYEINDTYFLVKESGQKKVIQDVTGMIETMEHMFMYSVWIFFLYLLISYPLGVFFLRTIYQKLFQATKHLEHDEIIDIDAMHLAPHDEIRLLFEKINSSMESIKQFNSYVSHEIKTPLMMAHSYLDVMKAQLENKSYDALKTKIPQIQKNLKNIAEIVDVLGKFILIENKSYPEAQEEVQCCDVVSSIISSYDKQVDADEIVFDIGCQGTIRTNPVLFTLLMRNLIDNAVKYSIIERVAKTKNISISLNIQGLTVKNFAKKPEHIESLSNKFYKEGNESGLGLGLYLVRKIVDLLGWEMKVSWKEGEFEVEIFFKAHKTDF